MASNVSAHQSKEGLSLSCHPGRGLEALFSTVARHWRTHEDEINRGGDESPPSGIGPWRGARVAPQHCPILRPGQDHGKQNDSSLQLQVYAGFQKEDISNELRTRTFLTSCDNCRIVCLILLHSADTIRIESIARTLMGKPVSSAQRMWSRLAANFAFADLSDSSRRELRYTMTGQGRR